MLFLFDNLATVAGGSLHERGRGYCRINTSRLLEARLMANCVELAECRPTTADLHPINFPVQCPPTLSDNKRPDLSPNGALYRTFSKSCFSR